MKYPILAIIAILALSCTRNAPEDATQPVIRLDQLMQAYPTLTPEQQTDTLYALYPELSAMLAVTSTTGFQPVTDEQSLDEWARSRVVSVFQPAVDSVFPDTQTLERSIGHILACARRDSLALPSLTFAAVTWGSLRPIVRVDSIVLIALNHYLGADYPGYSNWPQYRRHEKVPEQLPYDLAGVLAATQYPKEDRLPVIDTNKSPDGATVLGASASSAPTDPTLLSWMLYEGALVEARMRLVQDAQLHRALAMTPEQLKLADDNCRTIWQEMAANRLVYETSPQVIDRYISPAPATPLLGGTAPGRIGRYIGYRIVRAYLDRHKDTSLGYLLSPAFYASPQTLIDSAFNPK